RSIDHQLLGLERSVAAECRVAIDHCSVRKGSNARANRRPGVRCESDSKAGLKNEVVRLRKTLGQPVEEPVEFARMQRGKTPAFPLGHSIAGKQNAVIRIAAY